MYGNDTNAAGVAILPITGLAMGGSWTLAAFGIVFVGIALFLLFRKNGEHRP